MNTIIATIAGILFFAAATIDEEKINKMRPPEQERELMRYYTGGHVKIPNEQRGVVYYVNAQKAAPREWIQTNIAYFAEKTRVEIRIENGEFDLPSPAVKGNATVFIIDDPAMPSSLLAAEDHWAMLNVAKIKTEKKAYFQARFGKALTRTVALLFGGGNSSYSGTLMSCMTKASDLDIFVDSRLPVDVLNRFKPYLSGYGITPYRLTTYRQACQEGWAHSPTNEYERYAWDDVHAVPTNPLKITFDKDKQKPVVK